MELLLWRWSVGVQWASLAMITVFFLILERSLRFSELRSWVAAWTANLLALGITVLYWNWRPTGAAFRGVAAAFLASKTAFALLLILGAVQLARPGASPWAARRLGVVFVALSLCGLFVPTLDVLGLVANPLVGLAFLAGGVALRRRGGGLSWLAAAMLLRSSLFLFATLAFTVTSGPLIGAPDQLLQLARSFLAVHSFVDTGAEWLLALAGVLAVSDRVSSELRQSNRDLVAAQEILRQMVDRDPLTALLNRRSLGEVFRRVQPGGALLLFFDLDGFKALNDRHGHRAGDECLRRFARGLRQCFRPGDALLRYGGDEFLVVAQGLEAGAAWERVERLRVRLQGDDGVGPQMRFSVGLAVLAPGGAPEAALEAADRSMYEAKGSGAG